MTPQDVIATADEVLQASQNEHLTDIQRMILRESMVGKTYEKMEGYSPKHIKDEGAKLWGLLSQALGETVSKKNFKGALEKRWRTGQVVLKPPSLSVYKSETWVGRSQLISELVPKLQDKTRSVWITGIPGIGKTTLGECLASCAWDTNPSFQWIYLEVLEGQGSDFTTIAAELLSKLGEMNLDPQERNDPKRLTDRLIRKLKTNAYWLQLDSLERLLNPDQGTEFLDSCWVTFLQRCLTEADFASRLVLTAQALPSALFEFCDRYSNFWQARTLSGLSVDDQHNEHLEFFDKYGVAVNRANRETLCKLGQVYEGHTYVLKVMSREIQEDFDGDVLGYWSVNQSEFEQVTRSLDSKRLDEMEYNDELDRKVREKIRTILQKLPIDAQDLLFRSSVYRRPVPKKFWYAMIDDRPPRQQKEAYRVLCDRALVERESIHQKQFLIRQHNLVRTVAYELLKGNHCIWYAAERQAAQIWLTDYKPAPDVSNLEMVRGYLEAFEHYCEVEDWETSESILMTELDTPDYDPLYWQLCIWGYYREQIQICHKILGKLDAHSNAIWLNNLGLAYRGIGQYQQAIDYHKQSLAISRKLVNPQGESNSLGNLGTVYCSLGQSELAIDYYQQALIISRKISDREGEGVDLGNLGLAYYRLGEYEEAIDYYEQSLTISREMNDLWREGNALGNLGNLFDSLRQHNSAIAFYQLSLVISQKLGDREGKGTALINIGKTQLKLEQYLESLTNNQMALEIFQEIDSRDGEAEALKNLAELHQALGEVEVARQYCQQALVLATELGIPLAEECRKLQEEIEASLSIASG